MTKMYVCDHADSCRQTSRSCLSKLPQDFLEVKNNFTKLSFNSGWYCVAYSSGEEVLVKAKFFSSDEEKSKMNYSVLKIISIRTVEGCNPCKGEFKTFVNTFLDQYGTSKEIPLDILQETFSSHPTWKPWLVKNGFFKERPERTFKYGHEFIIQSKYSPTYNNIRAMIVGVTPHAFGIVLLEGEDKGAMWSFAKQYICKSIYSISESEITNAGLETSMVNAILSSWI